MSHSKEKLSALRQHLKTLGMAGFVVPLTDEHMSEYVGAYAKRLEWLTGFAGSAGSAIVLHDTAAMFTDGRYTLQVRAQVDGALYSYEPVPEVTHADWLKAHVKAGDVIGYDPWYHSTGWVKTVGAALASVGALLKAVEGNPVDAVWPDQPEASLAEIYPHPEALAGKPSIEKRTELGKAIAALGAEVAVVSALDSIAWLFNIRGQDVEHTPVPRAYALLNADGTAILFTEAAKITPALRVALGDHISIQERCEFVQALQALGRSKQSVLVDKDSTVAAIFSTLESAGATIIDAADPCILAKACKNATEIAGTKAAHIRDGAALTRFLHWLSIEAPKSTVDELQAVDQLYRLRAETNQLIDTSFDTISGAGPNGAIVHYRSTPSTNRPLQHGELFLIDSGGQYRDGTTDVTRTIAIGTVGTEEKDRFTRVLRGHIAIATARFPSGTSGRNLDTLARMPLWQAGLDYDHGTGHGVGSFLAVHEGPQRIAKASSDIPLMPGMIVSNEPGYYKSGAYGIRIENLVLVAEQKHHDDERDMLGFETLTLAPIDRTLVDVAQLNPHERLWLNAYHARVRDTLTPLLPDETKTWLATATAPI